MPVPKAIWIWSIYYSDEVHISKGIRILRLFSGLPLIKATLMWLVHLSTKSNRTAVQKLLPHLSTKDRFREVVIQYLWAACSSSSPETVRILLDHGAKYERNWYRATPLLATATYACPDVAKTLLDYHRRGRIDACLNQRAKNGRTALYEACEYNRQRILEQLLDAGADYTIRDDHDCTPLHAGTHHDGIGVLTALYKKVREADDEHALNDFINARAKSGQTALSHAVDRNKPAHVRFLLDCGADYAIAGHLGNNPLHRACYRGNESLCRVLVEYAKQNDETLSFREFLDLENREGCTALLLAAREPNFSIVQLLLDHGADFTVANHHDVTPLHAATWRGFKITMVLLLERATQQLDADQFSAFINRRNDVGITALMDSVQPLRKQFRMEITTILLDYGADATISRPDDITTLHLACYEGRLDLTQLLLDHTQQKLSPSHFTAFLNHRNDKGRSALYYAIRAARSNPEMEILELLLQRGADYTLPNKENVTPLHTAAYHGHVAVVQLLLSYGSKDNPERFKAFINARNDWGKTALHDSCEKGRPKVTKLLMDYGISFTLEDQKGQTALHCCIPRDQVKTMRVLLEQASVLETTERFHEFLNHRRRDDEMTALHDLAVKGNCEMMRALLQHGADFESYDFTKHTPIETAISHGHGEMAAMLRVELRRQESRRQAETQGRLGNAVNLVLDRLRRIEDPNGNGQEEQNGDGRKDRLGRITEIQKSGQEEENGEGRESE